MVSLRGGWDAFPPYIMTPNERVWGIYAECNVMTLEYFRAPTKIKSKEFVPWKTIFYYFLSVILEMHSV